MKEKIKSLIISNIKNWTDTDIYALSLFVYDDNDNPCKPTVTLGYNTESCVADIAFAEDDAEARWNYAYWLQNEFFCFGSGNTAADVKNWIMQNGFPYYEDNDPIWQGSGRYDEADRISKIITKAFVSLLVEIVQEIHSQKILTEKFGKELPIIIHELEYYEEIAEQNIKANGDILDREFIDFCE